MWGGGRERRGREDFQFIQPLTVYTMSIVHKDQSMTKLSLSSFSLSPGFTQEPNCPPLAVVLFLPNGSRRRPLAPLCPPVATHKLQERIQNGGHSPSLGGLLDKLCHQLVPPVPVRRHRCHIWSKGTR